MDGEKGATHRPRVQGFAATTSVARPKHQAMPIVYADRKNSDAGRRIREISTMSASVLG
jgi:hypothetical protein